MSGDRQRFVITPAQAGKTLAGLVRAHLSVSWSQAKRHVTTGKAFVDDARVTDVSYRPRVGQAIEVRMNAPRPTRPGERVDIVYEDAHVVIIDKPAGVSSVPYEPRETGTAMDLLRAAWRRKYPDAGRIPLHVVHRIDKATSGLLMFAKTKRAERGLAAQLRAHLVDRRYVCAVHGRARSSRIESRLVRDRGDGLRGSIVPPGRSGVAPQRHKGPGKRAVTHVEVASELIGATLCHVRLETGKTHQIRIHLSELGHPLIGETVYIRTFIARGHTPIESPRLLLHAATLGFEHPITGKPVARESALPEDFERVLARLR